MINSKLTLDDIADVRAYEREREQFRSRIISLKKLRRVGVGPLVSFVFENRDTVRFQVQEMARAERLISDEAIQVELDTYNPLIPGPGELSASMFIELTDRAQMEKWLPALVGIESSAYLLIGQGSVAERVACEVDPEHAQRLTREEVTAAVHFVRFKLDHRQASHFVSQPVRLGLAHPAYSHETELSEQTKASLAEDLEG